MPCQMPARVKTAGSAAATCWEVESIGRKLGIGGRPVNRYDGYMKEPLRILSLGLLGGHPALDFVNTLDWRGRAAAEAGRRKT